MHLRTVARPALLVLMVLGLLVMPHTAHGGSVGGAAAQHVMSEAVGMPGQAAADMEPSADATGHVSGALASAGPPAPAPLHASLALSCLVILLAAVAYLVLHRTGRVPLLHSTATLPARAATRRAGRGPPRLLLAQICVLRT